MAEQPKSAGHAPLVKTVTVPWTQQAAFARFTEKIGTWWPLSTHACDPEHATGATVECRVGGRLYETTRDGNTHTWGTVLAIDEPRRIQFTWHPGRAADTAQTIDVQFDAEGDGTRVTITHSGWDVLGEKAGATRSDYDTGWDFVLGRYATA